MHAVLQGTSLGGSQLKSWQTQCTRCFVGLQLQHLHLSRAAVHAELVRNVCIKFCAHAAEACPNDFSSSSF